MKKLRRVLVCTALLAVASANAASPESVERLMQAMQVDAQFESMYAQAMPAIRKAIRQNLVKEIGSEDAMRVYDAIQARVDGVQRSMLMMQQRMGPLLQEMMRITKEEAAKELARSAPRR